MRNLSNNNYIASADKSALGLSIFDGVLPKKHLSENEMHTVVRDFLARLKFDIHTVGYKYWAKLLQLYLVRDDYNQDASIEVIAERYGVANSLIKDNLETLIERNSEFVPLASKLLGVDVTIDSISDAADVLGAIFHIYFPQIECDECDVSRSHINFLQVMEYVQRTSKKD